MTYNNKDIHTPYPRDLKGYGENIPHPNWPNKAKIAVQFVLNYEEGGENTILHGDEGSEVFLSDIIGAPSFIGARHMSMESIYEYGARAGVWRILDLFKKYDMPLTIFAVAMAAMRAPHVIERCMKDGHEIASHGFRWINYHGINKSLEREHMQQAIDILSFMTGERPLGWYTGRTSENTRDLLHEAGGFLYDSDDYSDDLPFWSNQVLGQHLVIPYSLEANDMRFATMQGFNTGEHFFQYLKDSFDILYQEGANGAPKMLSIGLHCRLIGLQKFLDYISKKNDVWVTRRVDIARHWHKNFPYLGPNAHKIIAPMGEGDFMKNFDNIYEHSNWILKRAFPLIKSMGAITAEKISHICQKILREATAEERLGLLQAHPDLAGKLALAGELTDASTKEQSASRLNECTKEQLEKFHALNAEYKQKFNFPFIMAVKYTHREEILRHFERRIKNSPVVELEAALNEVHKIALWRMSDIVIKCE
jgi:OHCU decarboxylase